MVIPLPHWSWPILAYLGLFWRIRRSGQGAHLQTWLGSWPRCPPGFPSPRSPHPPRRSLSGGELGVACNVNHQSTIFGWFIVKKCNFGVDVQNWVYHITPNEPSLTIIIHYLPKWLEINGHHPPMGWRFDATIREVDHRWNNWQGKITNFM